MILKANKSLGSPDLVKEADYEKFVELNNKRYSHIINPITGYPKMTIKKPPQISIETASFCFYMLCLLTVVGSMSGDIRNVSLELFEEQGFIFFVDSFCGCEVRDIRTAHTLRRAGEY